MRILLSMVKKEFKEMMRNYKWLTVPILFIILSAMQPITYYYLPDILKMSTLPEGAILQIPLPTPSETMFAVFGQLNQMGLLILVLVSMGAIANEVKSGVADTILVKPISIYNYILSKWIAFFSITIVSTIVGILAGWFYTEQLIGGISGLAIFKSTLIYIIYLLFFISLTLLLSSIFNSSIIAGGITIIAAIGISIFSALPFDIWWLPSYLLQLNKNILYQTDLQNLWISILINLVYIVFMYYISVYIFKKQEKSFS